MTFIDFPPRVPLKVYQKGTDMKNIVAIVLGTLSYAGLYTSLMYISSKVSGMVPFFPVIVQIVLLCIVLEVSFVVSFTGADFIYTKKYAIRSLVILQSCILTIANIITIGEVSWVFHLISLLFIVQYLLKGFSKGDAEDESLSVGLVLLLCSIAFSVIVIFIAYF